MSREHRTRFYQSIADRLADGPLLLRGGMGSGKTTTLREIAALLNDRPNSLAIILPLPEICFSPEFFHSCAARIARDSAKRAGIEEFAESFESALESPPKESKLSALSAIESAAKRSGVDPVILIDEIHDLNVLKSFPGHGDIFEYFCKKFIAPRRLSFAFTTAFGRQAAADFAEQNVSFQDVEIPALGPEEIEVMLKDTRLATGLADDLAAFTGGVPRYVEVVIQSAACRDAPIGNEVFADALSPGAPLEAACRFHYEYLVGRSRGEGVIRHLLAVICRLDMPNLTEIANTFGRSLGVTKDYLKWMLAVGLIGVRDKRYFFEDPLLRAWIRLYRGGEPADRLRVEAEINELTAGGDVADQKPKAREISPPKKKPAAIRREREAQEELEFELPPRRAFDIEELD